MDKLHLLLERNAIRDNLTYGSLYYRLNNSHKVTKICDTVELLDRNIDLCHTESSLKYNYKLGSALPYGEHPIIKSSRFEGTYHVTPVSGFHNCYIGDHLELKSGCIKLINNPLNLVKRFKDFKIIDILISQVYEDKSKEV